jgi:hypothetical protein
MDANSFCVEQGKPGVFSTYKYHMKSFLFYSMHVIYCVLHIGFLDDGNMLHGSTLPDITLL